MNIKKILFILYDLGFSLWTLSMLHKEASETQLNELLKGEYLELQFSLGIFSNKEIELITSKKLKESTIYIEKKLQEFAKENIKYIYFYENSYPIKLKSIPHPPFFLFYKGQLELLEDYYSCSIVGTRKPTENTLNEINLTVTEMVKSKIIIVSGLALGTDIQAHKTTLDNEGKAVAVLPSPINEVTPKSHQYFAQKIINTGGLLISEYYKNDFKKTNYINRNRIVSGLSNAVIIAECSEKSGTMHTARFAYKQKKPIFCFNNNSTGVRKILSSDSAKIYTGIHDLPME